MDGVSLTAKKVAKKQEKEEKLEKSGKIGKKRQKSRFFHFAPPDR